MRKDIKMLCVTNWGAVLELITHPYSWCQDYRFKPERTYKVFKNLVAVADPDAIDAGQILLLDEIKLVIRRKR